MARQELVPLEQVARTLARGKRGAEADEILRVLRALGLPRVDCTKLEQACLQDAARAKHAKPDTNDEAKALRLAVQKLVPLLERPDADQQRQLASQLLLLDARCTAAHKVLGHEQHEGQWTDPIEGVRSDRRRDIDLCLQHTRKRAVEIEVGESDDAMLQALYGRKGTRVRWKNVVVHTCWAPEKAQRVMREVVRALALSRALLVGQNEPPAQATLKVILLEGMGSYQAALAWATREGTIDPKELKHAQQLSGFDDKRGFRVKCCYTEADAEASLLLDLLASSLIQPCLRAGHCNWLCLALWGVNMPSVAWTEAEDGAGKRAPGTVATLTEASEPERKEQLRLAKAGLAGCRSWLQWLARRHEDPPFSRAMVDAIGKIRGDDLLKCTMVAEMLHEESRLKNVDRLAWPKSGEITVAQFELGLAQSLADFEARFRSWLLREDPALAERLEHKRSVANPEDVAVLTYLNGLRAAAFRGTSCAETQAVTLERSLSAGCAAHARYLAAHPEQALAWPDAHEEYPDQAGFSPAGARAGLRSVIAPGVASAQQAIDGWMGTFYHRLPLLEPGLLRIGFGLDQQIAVLDSGSLCAPSTHDDAVAWPHAGMSRVPLAFQPELPNPVPGQDQAGWGYPITLQFATQRRRDQPLDVVMRLLEGAKERGKPIDCWFSSPSQPTNKDLAPAAAFCLIPKSRLKPGMLYTVVAEIAGAAAPLVWSFRT